MSGRLPEKFFAIPRHAFYADEIINPPNLPYALSDFFNPNAPKFSKPDSPAIKNSIEYFVMPAKDATGWGGLNPLNRLLNILDNKSGKPPVHRSFSTLTFSKEVGTKNDTTIAQLGHEAFEELKKVAGDRITEVASLEELMQARAATALQTQII